MFLAEQVPLSLQQFNMATELMLGLCLAIPGLAFTNFSPGVTGLLLLVHIPPPPLAAHFRTGRP